MKAKRWLIVFVLLAALGLGGIVASTYVQGTAVHAEPSGG